jgi:hypothetical protein
MERRLATMALLFLVCGLAACASDSVLLVQPRTGATIKCGGSGSGIMFHVPAEMVDECVRRYGPDGYVPESRLTPAERADLERRGVLPKPAESRPTM